MGPISLSIYSLLMLSLSSGKPTGTLSQCIEAMGEVALIPILKENTKKKCRELFVPKYFNC
jgi:hypothetical protein